MSTLNTLSLQSRVNTLPLNIKSDINLDISKTIKIDNITVLSSNQVLGKILPLSDIVGINESQIISNKTLTDTIIDGNFTSLKNINFGLIDNNQKAISFDSVSKKNILQIDTTLNNEKVKIGSNLEVEANLAVKANLTVGANLTINGNMIVNGETTIVQSSTLQVNDKNIELAYANIKSDIIANGGGITLKGDTDKTINWSNDTKAWKSSEHFAIAANKNYYIDNKIVLSTDQILGVITRKNISLNVNTIKSIIDVFENQTSGQYNFFDLDDPRISGIIYLKTNLNAEPDVRVESNGDFVNIFKDFASRLNIFIENDLVSFQNKTNNIINLVIYKKV